MLVISRNPTYNITIDSVHSQVLRMVRIRMWRLTKEDKNMKKFIMTSECMPHSSDTWFPMFGEGDVIEGDFSSQEEAQDYLDEQCRMAGTDEDEYFIEHGPYAKEEE